MSAAMIILIVDDHPGMCQTLQDILEAEGHTVHMACSGGEAIAQCQTQPFDLILLDVWMPDLNGVETYRRVKALAEGPHVIMMSAYSDEDLKREALAEGAIAFLQKPLEVDQVLSLTLSLYHKPHACGVGPIPQFQSGYSLMSRVSCYSNATAVWIPAPTTF